MINLASSNLYPPSRDSASGDTAMLQLQELLKTSIDHCTKFKFILKLILRFHISLFVFAILSSLPLVSSAEEIEISVHTSSEPKAALGLFFTSGKVVQQPNTSFERINSEVVLVRMPYEVANLPSASPFATAYLLTVDDEIVLGDVRLVSTADASESFWRLNICPADVSKIKVDIPVYEQLSYLESLQQVRIKKREVARKLLQEKLHPELLSYLQKLESRFGLTQSSPLSAELSGLELVERIARLKNTIVLYRSTKTINKPAAATKVQ